VRGGPVRSSASQRTIPPAHTIGRGSAVGIRDGPALPQPNGINKSGDPAFCGIWLPPDSKRSAVRIVNRRNGIYVVGRGRSVNATAGSQRVEGGCGPRSERHALGVAISVRVGIRLRTTDVKRAKRG